MITRRLLYLDTHRLSAFLWQRGSLIAEGSFEANGEDLARFSEYLRRHGRSHFELLANVAEEGYQIEVIPYLQGADRRTLIERKIGQVFFGTSLATSVALGYEKGKRKNERILLTALTNPGHFEPWLAALRTAEAPLQGLYTIAQVGAALLRRLGPLPERCVLLTMQDHSIRESFVVNGIAQFSRMAPLYDSSGAGIAAAFAAEAPKLHQYLIGQRLIGRSEPLAVFVFAHPDTMAAIQGACIEAGGLSYKIVDLHDLSRRIGLRSLPADNRCDPLFLHQLAVATPRPQFADEEKRHDYRISQIKQALLAVGAVALFGGLLFSAKQFYNLSSMRQEVEQLNGQEADLKRRYDDITATFPQLGVGRESLRTLVSRYTALHALQREPGDLYRRISQALNQAPAVELQRIDWKLAAGANATATPRSAAVPKAGLLTSSDEVATIHGTVVLGQTATPRQILTAFESLVRALGTAPGLKVTVLQQPFDIDSGRALKGGDQEHDSRQPRAFVVEIARKIEQ